MFSCIFCNPLVLTLAAESAQAPPSRPAHHAPEGFRNNYPHDPKASFWLWKWEQLRHGVPGPPPGGWKVPWMKTDAASLRNNPGEPRLTWIGHASFLVQLEGRNVLIDPQFSERASPVPLLGPRRIVALPLGIDELPSIHVVLISHNHYDHLDEASVRALAARAGANPIFLVPLGLRAWFAEKGIERVREYDWWDVHDEGPLRFTFVPVQHWSKRTLWDTNQSLWGGWVVEGAGLRLIHTGDLGYSQDARDIGSRLGPFDLALIPIGAYAPRWFMKTHHVDVPEAVRVRADLRADRAIGMHWGTFENISDEPLDEPPAWLERERAAGGLPRDGFDVMKIGETRRILPGARAGESRP